MALSSRQPWFRRINAPLWAALVATVVCVVLVLGHHASVLGIPGLSDWEQSTVDLRFRLRGAQAPKNDRIVIVALDDVTRREMSGMWQTRHGFAKLIRAIAAAKPRAFAIDAFFTTPEEILSPEVLAKVVGAREALAGEQELTSAAQLAKEALADIHEEASGDAALASAMRDADSLVLALLFYLDGDPLPPGSAPPAGVAKASLDESVFIEQPLGQRPPLASGYAAPLPALGRLVPHMGHVNVHPDSDGTVRQTPLLIEAAGRYYQSLALKLASMELGAPTSYVAGDSYVMLDTKKIPVSPQTLAHVSYLGPNHTFTRVSAAEVLRVPGGHPRLRDAIVLLGYTDSARDKIATPFDRSLDGVELHATLVHNILHDELIAEAGPWATLLAIALFGGLLCLLQLRPIRRRGGWILGAVALVLGISYAIVAHLLFVQGHLLVEVVAPLLSAVLITLTALTMSLATEGRERAQLRSAFGQYLQPTLVARLLHNPDRLRLGGQRRELTVLFSDIRGFSQFSEQLQPEKLSDFLNEYLTPMTELVMDNSGMLDKYIGDAVMAVYGAPLPIENHATRACGTALAMLTALGPLNASWKARELPEIRIGIGINTGNMSVGNMGSERRFDYTVMGDAVNLGARLESLTKAYQVDILVGEATMLAAKEHYCFREVDRVQVIGRKAAASVYELCGTAEDPQLAAAQRTLFASALQAYRAQQWQECEEVLERFLEQTPDDGPSQTLLARLSNLRATDLPVDWDGVYEQQSK